MTDEGSDGVEKKEARAIQTDSPAQVEVGIYVDGKQQPIETLTEEIPEEFPLVLVPHLADFMARGFNAAFAPEPRAILLDDMAETLSGRPLNDEVQEIGREAAMLHKKNPKLKWQQIALKVCPQRGERGHHCKKQCADRIRQAAKTYETRQDLKRLARGEG